MAVNVNVTKVDSSNSISLTKGASQQSLNTAVSQALSYRDTSVASAESATQSEANALGYANNANTYATNASASASSASASEIASALSETNASISATSAANSATTANSERLLAEAAELSASNSSTSAQGYANDALGYRNDAQTAASNASTSEANASTSETNASASALSASTSEINASASATAASLSETNASASELSASNSATTATTQASIATTQATNASNSASAAATSEANAGISESNAALSESNAATSEANAAISETNANNSATSAANSLATFQGQYVSSATEPTSPDVGDLWYDEITSLMKVYDGTIWQLAGSSVNGTSSRNTYTSTQGQTTFSATYDVGYVDVYVNGLKLQDTIDFTATDGTNVVLASGVNAGDIIDIVAYGTFALADHYTKIETDTLLNGKADNATTLSGYGITDAYTKTEVDNIDYETNIAPYNRGFKNYIINGNFDIWQRGTSFSAGGYTADRWRAYSGTSVTRWNYPNTAAGFVYACNVNFNGAYCGIEQRIENGYLFKNREVTLSFRLRTITPTNGSYLYYKFKKISDGSTINGGLIANGFNNTAMSGYEYRSITFTPIYTGTNIENADIMLEVSFMGSGATAESGEFNIAGVQLEEGSVATPFEQRPYGLELSLCQRYYNKNYGGGASYAASGAAVQRFSISTKEVMRVTPSVVLSQIGGNGSSPEPVAVYPKGVLVGWSAPSAGYEMSVEATFSAEL